MKLPFPALAALAFLSASCGPSPLLDDIQKEVTTLAEPIATPSIVPAGGAFRYSTPAVTITTTTPGSRLFYTLNGSHPVYNSHGRPAWPNTNSTDQSSMGWPSLGAGMGVYPVKAVAWRDGVVSSEAEVVFRVVGDGGVIGAKTGFKAPGGQVLALTRSTSGLNYVGGWIKKDGNPKTGFVACLDNGGEPLWMVPLVATEPGATSEVTGMATDTSGNVYITGTLTPVVGSAFKFSGSHQPNVSGPSGFLAAYHPGGGCLWAVTLLSGVPVTCTGVAIDQGTGSLFVSGWAEGSSAVLTLGNNGVPLGPVNLPSKAGSSGYFSNAFLAKYDASGNPVGVFSSGVALGADRFLAVAVQSGTIAVVGQIRAQSNGDSFDYSADVPAIGDANQWNALLVTLNWPSMSPTATRARSVGTGVVGETRFQTVALFSSRILAGGYQVGTGTRNWGNAKTWNGFSAGENALVVAYDTTGTTLWVAGARPGFSAPSMIHSLAFNPMGTFVFAAGRLGSDNYSWDTAPVTYAMATSAPTGRSPLRLKLDPSTGSATWFQSSFPGSGDAELFAVSPGPPAPDGPTVVYGGTQVGTLGVEWGFGYRQPAPGNGENPLLLQAYD